MNSKSNSCCANCGTLSEFYVTNQCPSCGYIGAKLPRVELVGYEDKLLFLDVENYSLNNTKAIFLQYLEDEDSSLEQYIEITTNIDDVELLLEDNEILVKTWSENSSIVPALLGCGYFEDTDKKIKVNYCEASIWKIIKQIL